MSCYYSEADCNSETWECETCGEEFCTETHWHETSKGRNVECVVCERERLTTADDDSEDDGGQHMGTGQPHPRSSC